MQAHVVHRLAVRDGPLRRRHVRAPQQLLRPQLVVEPPQYVASPGEGVLRVGRHQVQHDLDAHVGMLEAGQHVVGNLEALRPGAHPDGLDAVGVNAGDVGMGARPAIEPAHLLHVAGIGVDLPGVEIPEDRDAQPAHHVPERLEFGVVEMVPPAGEGQRLDLVVEAAQAQRRDGVLQPLQLRDPVRLPFPNLGQGQEAAGERRHLPAEVFIQAAVDVIVLQHRHVDAQVVHVGDQHLRPARHVGEGGRIPLQVVVDAGDGAFELAVGPDAQVHVRHVGDGVAGRPQQGGVGARAVVAPAPALQVELRVMLDDLQLLRGGLIAGVRPQRREDMGVAVDDHGDTSLRGA